MARISAELRFTPEQVDAYLAKESRLRIATVAADGQINLTPMTFGWAGRQIYIFGRGQKIADIRRSGTATVLIDTGEQWRELKGVMLRGRAAILETVAEEEADPHLADAQLNLGMKHGLTEAGRIVPYKASASGKSRRWIVFQPDSVVSWDNARLP